MLTRRIGNLFRYNRQPCIKKLQINFDNLQITQASRPEKCFGVFDWKAKSYQELSLNSYGFTTSKKVLKNGQKKIFKLKKTHMVPGQNFFLLYDAQKQQISFLFVSGLFLILIGLSMVKLSFTDPQLRKDQKDEYVLLLIVIGSFIVYQRRILKTLKRVTLDSKGEKLNISTFNLLGYGQTTVQAPIEIMTGISRATRFGGYFLKGGGKSSLYKEMNFWFSKQYLTNQEAFQYVAEGKFPKIVDQYQSL